jgi:hypothetical protein
MPTDLHEHRERTDDRGALVTAAEAAECNCPDFCELDHGND